LAEQRRKEGLGGEVSESDVTTAESLANATGPASAPAPPVASPVDLPKDWNRDDPLQHYLNSTNSSSGGRNDGRLGAPQQDMTDLKPDPRMQRQGECLRNGGRPDLCR
jgi:hypothetical protein